MSITAVTHSKEVWELLAENESLRHQLADVKSEAEREADAFNRLADKFTKKLAGLESALIESRANDREAMRQWDECKKDAERYQLRYETVRALFGNDSPSDIEIDAAIDAAIGETKC